MRTSNNWLLGGSLVVLTGLSWVPPQADGYALEVHKDFFDLAFGLPAPGQRAIATYADAGRAVTPPSAEGLVAFRRLFWERASGRKPGFKTRWPSFESFDAAAFKEFLALNPGKSVVAIDHVPASRTTDVRTVVREGSVDPDNDYRNQDRLFLQGGEVVLDAFGRAVPYDPRTTWFGGLTGTPSQFDAHGATLRSGEKGSGIMTAIRHPEQFARPAVVLGSAPEFSENYTELAMIAKLSGGEGSEWLALTFGGNNLHGIEDLGNQIHTTVLGIPEFFVDAKYTYYKMRLKRMFKKKRDLAAEGFVAPSNLTTDQVNQAMRLIKDGKLDQVDPQVRFALGQEPNDLPSDTDIGIRIIGNHHRLLEDFTQKQYLRSRDLIQAGQPDQALPEVTALIQTARRGDPAFERKCREALRAAGLGTNQKGTTPYARAIAELMIEASAPEAAPIYRATRKISKKSLQREETYNEDLGHEVLDFVQTSSMEDEHVRKIWELQGNAWARVVTAVRLWDETFQEETGGVKPGSPEALARIDGIVDNLVERQMQYLADAEQRRNDYLAERQAAFDAEQAEANNKGMLKRIRSWFGD